MALVYSGMQNTPEQIAGRVRFGQGQLEQASSGAPVGGTGWLQALAHGLQGGIGGYGQYSAEQDQLAERQRNAALVAGLTQGGKTPTYADLMGLSTDPWTPPAALTLGAEMLKKDKDKWAINPKTGQMFNENTGEVKPLVPGQTAPQDMNDFRGFIDASQKGQGTQRWNQVAPILQSMERSIEKNTKISDLDFANGIAKVLDPTTGVLGGEQANIMATAQSIGGWLGGKFLAAAKGEGQLSPEERASIYELARNRAQGFYEQAQNERNYWVQQGVNQFGMKPEMFPPLIPLGAWTNPYPNTNPNPNNPNPQPPPPPPQNDTQGHGF